MLERLDRLYHEQVVDIYEDPFTEQNLEGQAKIISIEELYKDGSYYRVDLVVEFNDVDKVERTKFYTT